MKNNIEKGFTLIELLIAIAIIGIIAAFAFPQYERYVLSTNRKGAVSELLAIQQKLERIYNVQNGAYILNAGDPLNTAGVCGTNSGVMGYPNNTSEAKYVFALDLASTQSYTLTATPCGAQLKDECGIFQIDNFNVKQASLGGSLSASSAADCF